MPLKSEHLADLADRLQAAATAGMVGSGPNTAAVFRGRLVGVPKERHPCLCLYAPSWDLEPIGNLHATYQGQLTLAIECRVHVSDGWDLEAQALAEQVLQILLSDTDWRRRWGRPPRVEVRQFVDHRSGPEPFCGEVITLSAEDGDSVAFDPPTPPTLDSATIDIDHTGDDQAALGLTVDQSTEI